MPNQFDNFGDMLSYILLQLGKDQEGQYISPEELQLVANEDQDEFMGLKVSEFEIDRRNAEDLLPFMKTYGSDEYPPLTLTSAGWSAGKVDLPEDCFYRVTANYLKWTNQDCSSTAEYKSLRFYSQDEFDEAMDMPMMSPIENSSEVHPAVVIRNGQLYVYPNIKKMSLTIIRKAAKMVFDYEEINGQPVYLPPGSVHTNDTTAPVGTASSSVEPEWPSQVWPELCNRWIRKFAINERSEFNLQTLPPSQ